MPRDRTGDLVNSGEVTPGETPAEYAGTITDTIPANPFTADEIIAAHRQRNASRAAPPPRPGAFHGRSLRRCI